MKIIYIFILCITVIANYYSQLIVSSFPYECIFNQSAAFYNTILKAKKDVDAVLRNKIDTFLNNLESGPPLNI